MPEYFRGIIPLSFLQIPEKLERGIDGLKRVLEVAEEFDAVSQDDFLGQYRQDIKTCIDQLQTGKDTVLIFLLFAFLHQHQSKWIFSLSFRCGRD